MEAKQSPCKSLLFCVHIYIYIRDALELAFSRVNSTRFQTWERERVSFVYYGGLGFNIILEEEGSNIVLEIGIHFSNRA